MKIKTSELTGAALDWVVATLEGTDHLFDGHEVGRLQYSTDWSQGGPIIEREKIAVSFDSEWGAYDPTDPADDGERWYAAWSQRNMSYDCYGSTPLIAAMRCFVASERGDEVDVPEELA